MNGDKRCTCSVRSILADSEEENNIEGNGDGNQHEQRQQEEDDAYQKCYKERRYTWLEQGRVLSRRLTDYECQLEDDVQRLQDALFSISSHYAKIQFRLRQIACASGDERMCLLRELQRITCQGLDASKDNDELPTLMSDVSSLGNVRVRQRQIIKVLRSRLTDLTEFTDTRFAIESESSYNLRKYEPYSEEDSEEETSSTEEEEEDSEDEVLHGKYCGCIVCREQRATCGRPCCAQRGYLAETWPDEETSSDEDEEWNCDCVKSKSSSKKRKAKKSKKSKTKKKQRKSPSQYYSLKSFPENSTTAKSRSQIPQRNGYSNSTKSVKQKGLIMGSMLVSKSPRFSLKPGSSLHAGLAMSLEQMGSRLTMESGRKSPPQMLSESTRQSLVGQLVNKFGRRSSRKPEDTGKRGSYGEELTNIMEVDQPLPQQRMPDPYQQKRRKSRIFMLHKHQKEDLPRKSESRPSRRSATIEEFKALYDKQRANGSPGRNQEESTRAKRMSSASSGKQTPRKSIVNVERREDQQEERRASRFSGRSQDSNQVMVQPIETEKSTDIKEKKWQKHDKEEDYFDDDCAEIRHFLRCSRKRPPFESDTSSEKAKKIQEYRPIKIKHLKCSPNCMGSCAKRGECVKVLECERKPLNTFAKVKENIREWGALGYSKLQQPQRIVKEPKASKLQCKDLKKQKVQIECEFAGNKEASSAGSLFGYHKDGTKRLLECETPAQSPCSKLSLVENPKDIKEDNKNYSLNPLGIQYSQYPYKKEFKTLKKLPPKTSPKPQRSSSEQTLRTFPQQPPRSSSQQPPRSSSQQSPRSFSQQSPRSSFQQPPRSSTQQPPVSSSQHPQGSTSRRPSPTPKSANCYIFQPCKNLLTPPEATPSRKSSSNCLKKTYPVTSFKAQKNNSSKQKPNCNCSGTSACYCFKSQTDLFRLMGPTSHHSMTEPSLVYPHAIGKPRKLTKCEKGRNCSKKSNQPKTFIIESPQTTSFNQSENDNQSKYSTAN
ncbi:muscle M-line assembly protein unc-89 [Drosophila sulfurigaster albostrigata]|uniref:muscle M-line assembly protein unc-89 n=1 Tax=Drosophila sulfurigaster albostrigata TaxID=89887 RepID=UPI002D218870|nr:muscle M-line assembly protein unc-89 [Drosophila sulfurigaster albostrigata]